MLVSILRCVALPSIFDIPFSRRYYFVFDILSLRYSRSVPSIFGCVCGFDIWYALSLRYSWAVPSICAFDIRGRCLRYSWAFVIRGPSLFVGLRYSWAFVIGGLVWLRYLICPPPCDIRGRCRFVGGACYIRRRVWLRHLICPSLRHSRMPFPCLLYSLFNC